jgi:hypothetical protein
MVTLGGETTRLVHPPHRVITAAGDLQDYAFGYARCSHCWSDQAYYIHHADLEQGYTFRCRICRLEMTVSTTTPAAE